MLLFLQRSSSVCDPKPDGHGGQMADVIPTTSARQGVEIDISRKGESETRVHALGSPFFSSFLQIMMI